jgi:hypothetical protein
MEYAKYNPISSFISSPSFSLLWPSLSIPSVGSLKSCSLLIPYLKIMVMHAAYATLFKLALVYAALQVSHSNILSRIANSQAQVIILMLQQPSKELGSRVAGGHG